MEFSIVCHNLKNGSDKDKSLYQIGTDGYKTDRKTLRESAENIDFLHIKDPIYPSEIEELVKDTENIRIINQLIISSPSCAIPRFRPHKINSLKFVNAYGIKGMSYNKYGLDKYTQLDTLILENSSIEIVYEMVKYYGSFKKLFVFNSPNINEMNFMDKTPSILLPYLSQIEEIILYTANYIWVLKSFGIRYLKYLDIINFNTNITPQFFKSCVESTVIEELGYNHIHGDTIKLISKAMNPVKYLKPKGLNPSSPEMGYILCYPGIHIDFYENKKFHNFILNNIISGSISLLRLKITGLNLLNEKNVDDFCTSLEYNKSISILYLNELKFGSIELMIRFIKKIKSAIKIRYKVLSIDLGYYINIDCPNYNNLINYFVNRDKKEIPELLKCLSDLMLYLKQLDTLEIKIPFIVDKYIPYIFQYTTIKNINITSILYGSFDNGFMKSYKPYRNINYSGGKCYVEYKKDY